MAEWLSNDNILITSQYSKVFNLWTPLVHGVIQRSLASKLGSTYLGGEYNAVSQGCGKFQLRIPGIRVGALKVHHLLPSVLTSCIDAWWPATEGLFLEFCQFWSTDYHIRPEVPWCVRLLVVKMLDRTMIVSDGKEERLIICQYLRNFKVHLKRWTDWIRIDSHYTYVCKQVWRVDMPKSHPFTFAREIVLHIQWSVQYSMAYF